MSIITRLIDRIEYEPIREGMVILAECIHQFTGQRLTRENLDQLTFLLFSRGFTHVHYTADLQYVTASTVHASVGASLQGITT